MSLATELLVSIVTQIGAVVVSGVAAIAAIYSAKLSGAVKKEVKNTHQTNLREDIDGVGANVISLHDRIHSLAEAIEHTTRRHDKEFARLWDAISHRNRR